MAPPLFKYPRTRHLEGSRLQKGDEDLDAVPYSDIAGHFLVVEEKLDGANAALSFDAEGQLWLQSRGHFLVGGSRERHFNLFKQWAHAHARTLWALLGDRYVVYGEWLYAKHTVFYDALPHYFLEFDVLDRHSGDFLSTARRHALFAGSPVTSVPVLWRGVAPGLETLVGLVGPSLYKSPHWRERLDAAAAERGLDVARVRRETDALDTMEGLYLKVEEDERVVGRYKWVRASFLQTVEASESHWLSRPIVPNQLREGVELFGDRS
jgi:hypothetical protein